MDFQKHEAFFSPVRMLKYHNGVGKDDKKAAELYKYNIQLSQSIYPLISILEVGLRNAIDKKMRSFFGSSDWIREQKKGFMIDPNLTYFDIKDKKKKPDNTFIEKVTKVENRLRFENTIVTHNKIVGDIGFGFWVKFFDAKPVSILKGAQISAFKNNPGKVNNAYSTLNGIRVLRNRISHQEPICFNAKGDLCLTTIYNKYNSVLEAIKWIDDDLLLWSKQFDNVLPVINEMNNHFKVTAAVAI